jgi:predicted ATP-grasp superfamily ATP-dependent carboligase
LQPKPALIRRWRIGDSRFSNSQKDLQQLDERIIEQAIKRVIERVIERVIARVIKSAVEEASRSGIKNSVKTHRQKRLPATVPPPQITDSI